MRQLLASLVLLLGSLSVQAPASAQAQPQTPVIRNPAVVLQTQEEPNEDNEIPQLSRATVRLAQEALEAQQRENRSIRNREGDAYSITCESVRRITVSQMAVTIECGAPDRFGDTRYELHYAVDRSRGGRQSGPPALWMAEQLISLAQEAQRNPDAQLRLRIDHSSDDPSDGYFWTIAGSSLIYTD